MFHHNGVRAPAALAVLTAAMLFGGVPAMAQPSSVGPGPSGMMGGPGMSPGMMGGAPNVGVDSSWPGGALGYDQVQAYIHDSARAGKVDARKNTITYGGREVTIDMIAVQPGHEDQTFEVGGLTNPTLIVRAGAVVHLALVNMDFGPNMEHGIVVTDSPPPYPFMSMAVTGPGVARVMPLLPTRSAEPMKTARYAKLSTTFTARTPGTYWYVCPTPAHAQQGMFGKLIVR